jgi:hypothetical protein
MTETQAPNIFDRTLALLREKGWTQGTNQDAGRSTPGGDRVMEKRPLIPRRLTHMARCDVCMDPRRQPFENRVARTRWIGEHLRDTGHDSMQIWDEWLEVHDGQGNSPAS